MYITDSNNLLVVIMNFKILIIYLSEQCILIKSKSIKKPNVYH